MGTDEGAPAEVASSAVVLARGAGYGALLGGCFGFFLVPVAVLLSVRDEPFELQTLVLGTLAIGLIAAVFGMCYGLVVGPLVGVVLLSVPATSRSRHAGWLAALAGPAVVALVSWLVFRPRMTIGGNESARHMVERAVMFYAYPCTAALLAGAFAGRRLVAPAPADSTPSWSAERPT